MHRCWARTHRGVVVIRLEHQFGGHHHCRVSTDEHPSGQADSRLHMGIIRDCRVHVCLRQCTVANRGSGPGDGQWGSHCAWTGNVSKPQEKVEARKLSGGTYDTKTGPFGQRRRLILPVSTPVVAPPAPRGPGPTAAGGARGAVRDCVPLTDAVMEDMVGPCRELAPEE